MKKTSIISILICCITFSTMTTSCEDMLSPDSERHSYVIAQDTLYSYWGIVKSLQNVAERYVILGECRGDLVSSTGYVTDSIRAILDFNSDQATDGSCRFLCASDYYHIINSCNAYLAQYDKKRTTGTREPYMLKEAAQVQAIRAWVYLQLIQVYGKVPFYTEPLLTTDKINNFMVAYDKAIKDGTITSTGKQATADNLVDLLEADLREAINTEQLWGLPQYDEYGLNNNPKVHSSKVMIPASLILGDLYLTKGDPVSCEKAAQCYYDYLSNYKNTGKMTAGGTLPRNYCVGTLGDGMTKAQYSHYGTTPWTETGASNNTSESITCIPSSVNKLWGTILRGVNNLYGFASEIRVNTEETSDTTSQTSARVNLTPQYDVKQLVASKRYNELCKEQKFEIYYASNTTELETADIKVEDSIGDARQYWVKDFRQTYENGLTNTEKFISKMNPTGYDFNVGAHVIYRKSMVWLRFAEALCGAGYPSYAFAILKNGLCNNDTWYPAATDYAVKDSAWYFVSATKDTIPTKESGITCATEAELIACMATVDTLTQAGIDAGRKFWTAVSRYNYADDKCTAILNYLDAREVKQNPTFLDFDQEVLNGTFTSQYVIYRSTPNDDFSLTGILGKKGDDNITYGIHSHGCGMLRYDERNSSYNYIDQVIKKAQENYNVTLTKETIYDGTQDDIVRKCVEDLIIDEMGLELAFEGCRFFDLMRVAHRRNDASYLANRVARRNGKDNVDAALGAKLAASSDNWYFKLPQ